MGSDTAVFVGAFNSDYGSLMAKDPAIIPAYKVTGLGTSLFSNRISHWFDLRGPSATVDTACSASMTALHMACETLRKGDSKLAIVSGANLILDPDIMLALSTLKYLRLVKSRHSYNADFCRFLSPDGRTYMFDQRANGYSRGEGIATLVLKPLSEALEANDPIHAILKNTRTNQDGKTPGITMPSEKAQTSLIQATYREAKLDPSETDFFEVLYNLLLLFPLTLLTLRSGARDRNASRRPSGGGGIIGCTRHCFSTLAETTSCRVN